MTDVETKPNLTAIQFKHEKSNQDSDALYIFIQREHNKHDEVKSNQVDLL